MLVPMLRCGRGGCRCGLGDGDVSNRTVAVWLVLCVDGHPPDGPSRARVVQTGGRSAAPVVKSNVAWSQAGACSPEFVASTMAKYRRPQKMISGNMHLGIL